MAMSFSIRGDIMKAFTKIKPYGEDAYTYWISGIYKIVSYNKGSYNAYFIPEWFDNWGNRVCPAPDLDIHNNKCWHTLNSAKRACKDHMTGYTPSDKVISRAATIKASLLEQAQLYA